MIAGKAFIAFPASAKRGNQRIKKKNEKSPAKSEGQTRTLLRAP